MNGADLLFYVGAGLLIWGVYRFEVWRAALHAEKGEEG